MELSEKQKEAIAIARDAAAKAHAEISSAVAQYNTAAAKYNETKLKILSVVYDIWDELNSREKATGAELDWVDSYDDFWFEDVEPGVVSIPEPADFDALRERPLTPAT